MSNTQLLEQPPSQRPEASRYWIITKVFDHSQLRALIITLASGEEALAAFSSQEEAELFFILGQVGRKGWQIRESSPGEITSLLMGPHVDVGQVALDPAPEMLAEKMGGLVSLKRDRFIDLILNKGR